LIDRQPDNVHLKDLIGEAKAFMPKMAGYKLLRAAMRERGYEIGDNSHDAIRLPARNGP
jgi:hypothetical protein